MNDKQRAEFEKWLQSGYNKDWLVSCNGYADPTVDRMWMAWQAAIASVVVRLPCWSEYDTPRQAIEACADRIKDAGVKHNDE